MALLIIHGRKGYLNAMNYCHGNDTDDDTAHMLAAMQAAVAGRRTLWIPAGTYLLSTALTPPAGLIMRGAGDSTYLHGQVRSTPHMTIHQMKIGTEIAGDVYDAAFGVNDCHSMLCSHVTFTGGSGNLAQVGAVLGWWGKDFYDCEFNDCVIKGDFENLLRNGCSVVNYGQADARVHDVNWNRLTVEPQGRMGFEVLSRSDAVHTYDYPVQNFNFFNSIFEQMGTISLSYGFHALHNETPPDGLGGDGWGQDGYSKIHDCHITDPGMVASGVAIELAPAVHMDIRRTHVVVSAAATKCTNFFSITNGTGQTELGYADTHNGVSAEIDTGGSVFDELELDAHLSASCSCTFRNSGWTLSDSTIISQGITTFDNVRNGTVTGNSITVVGADGVTPHTTKNAVRIQGSDGITLSGNAFVSGITYSTQGTVFLLNDGRAATNPAVNIVLNGNTYATGNKSVYVSADSTASGTDKATLGAGWVEA